jgi:hypothetical protein
MSSHGGSLPVPVGRREWLIDSLKLDKSVRVGYEHKPTYGVSKTRYLLAHSLTHSLVTRVSHRTPTGIAESSLLIIPWSAGVNPSGPSVTPKTDLQRIRPLRIKRSGVKSGF